MEEFINTIKTALIGTVDKDNLPFSSYAPYVHHENRFYVYLSDIATHAKNIQQNSNTSLFFIEDESSCKNLFARKRVSLQCNTTMVQRESERFEMIMGLFEKKFDAKMIHTLKEMKDFNLYEFIVNSGEATFGFGEAYVIGGEDMNELIPRSGDIGHKH